MPPTEKMILMELKKLTWLLSHLAYRGGERPGAIAGRGGKAHFHPEALI